MTPYEVMTLNFCMRSKSWSKLDNNNLTLVRISNDFGILEHFLKIRKGAKSGKNVFIAI